MDVLKHVLLAPVSAILLTSHLAPRTSHLAPRTSHFSFCCREHFIDGGTQPSFSCLLRLLVKKLQPVTYRFQIAGMQRQFDVDFMVAGETGFFIFIRR